MFQVSCQACYYFENYNVPVNGRSNKSSFLLSILPMSLVLVSSLFLVFKSSTSRVKVSIFLFNASIVAVSILFWLCKASMIVYVDISIDSLVTACWFTIRVFISSCSLAHRSS